MKRVAFIFLFLLPMLLPFFVTNQYYVSGILCRIFVYTIFVASLDIVVGYIGDISIGHAGLFAIGAYSVAILTGPSSLNAEGNLAFLPEWPFAFAVLIGIGLAAIAGLILGFPSLRSSGPYLAVSTIACGLIVFTIVNEQESLTNGTKGLHVAGLSFDGFGLFEPLRFQGNRFLWIAYPSMLAVMWMMRGFGRSFWGRAFEAIKFSSIAAESCGVHRTRFKISAFVISAALAGFAGGLFVQLDQYIAPGTFSLDFSILALMALIFGGLRSNLGNFLGMTVLVILPDLFTAFSDYRLIAFGVLLLLTLFFLPEGIAGLLKKQWRNFFPSQDQDLRRAEFEEVFRKSSREAPFSVTSKMDTIALALNQIRMQFGGLVAVNDLELRVKSGTIHGLMGPNGSGKSTTVNLITGVYAPTAGIVSLFGCNSNSLKIYERAQQGVARTFQNLQLFGGLTVIDNVLVGLHLSFHSSLFKVMLGFPSVAREERQLRERAYALLKFVGLEALAFETAANLAYGQARRLEIARALGLNPSLLLLDEPAAGLTTSEIQEFNGIIRKIRDQGVAIVLIEHHMDMLMEISDEITVLDFGKKIASGPPQTIQNHPEVIRAYLGTASQLGVSGGDGC